MCQDVRCLLSASPIHPIEAGMLVSRDCESGVLSGLIDSLIIAVFVWVRCRAATGRAPASREGHGDCAESLVPVLDLGTFDEFRDALRGWSLGSPPPWGVGGRD